MKTSVVYVSVTGNTKVLADEIVKKVGACDYVGKPADEALESDTIYVGFWTAKFTCTPDIEAFLKKLSNKKVFLFGTAGYDNTQEYFDKILDSVAAHLNDSNQVIGRFMCQAKVSDNKKKALESADADKFRSMQEKLGQGDSHPDGQDLEALRVQL